MTIIATANHCGTTYYFHEVQGRPDNVYTHYYGVTKNTGETPHCTYHSMTSAIKSLEPAVTLRRENIRLREPSQIFYPRRRA